MVEKVDAHVVDAFLGQEFWGGKLSKFMEVDFGSCSIVSIEFGVAIKQFLVGEWEKGLMFFQDGVLDLGRVVSPEESLTDIGNSVR